MTAPCRNTRQRQLVLDAVRARCDHPTADELYSDVRAIDAKISRGTVYRNLNLLSENGAIRIVHAPGGNRFDRRVDCHPHVICQGCGAVVDAPLPYDSALDARAEQETGYSVDLHSTLFYGSCPLCQQQDG